MIPILYEATETSFNTNGLGMLSDATSCQVTEERNGEYELEMEYPETGALFASLGMSKIILAEPGKNRTTQPFRIYKISKPLRGIVTVNARHISYQLSYVPVMPFAAVSSASAALNALKNNAAESCPFLFQTDVVTNGTFSVSEPQSLRSVLGGQDGSVLDVFGGEYEFDRYNVILHAQRGVNNGVTLRYGKNITDIEQEENIANTTTGICPYWAGSDGDMVTLPEKVVSSDNAENFPFPMTVPLDMSSEFDQKPTVEQLREAAQDYVKRNNLGVPSVSISLSFVDLSQTEEYKDIAPMESVELCDTVTVIFERLGVSAEAEVVRTEYDVLAGRYINIEVGSLKATLSSTIASQEQELKEKTSSSFLQGAIDRATGWITGVNGGYVVLHKNGNGQPYELLIMDTPDISTATKVWRWNQGGLGYSDNGYDGPYETAITQDGAIVASFITAGTMQANRINGGTLTLGGKDNANGVLIINNASGQQIGRWDRKGIVLTSGIISDLDQKNIWNLDTGELSISSILSSKAISIEAEINDETSLIQLGEDGKIRIISTEGVEIGAQTGTYGTIIDGVDFPTFYLQNNIFHTAVQTVLNNPADANTIAATPNGFALKAMAGTVSLNLYGVTAAQAIGYRVPAAYMPENDTFIAVVLINASTGGAYNAYLSIGSDGVISGAFYEGGAPINFNSSDTNYQLFGSGAWMRPASSISAVDEQ